MVNIEKVISRAGSHQFININLLKTIEDSIKLGFIDRDKLEIVGDQTAFFDPALISIAFKNLIDNGIKYSNNNRIKILILNNKIIFISKGEKLEKDWNEYIKPFSHSQISSKRGFGLGLYITNEIFLKHNWQFRYRFFCRFNIFEVKLS